MLLVFLKIVNFPKHFWEIGLNFGIPIDFNWEIPMGNTKGISHTIYIPKPYHWDFGMGFPIPW